jgi:hypothetical protein
MIYNYLTFYKSFVNISTINGEKIVRKIKYSAAPNGVKAEVLEYVGNLVNVVFSDVFPSFESAYMYIHFSPKGLTLR